MGVGSLRRRILRSGSVSRRRDLWIIIVAAAVFSLVAMWSMPGFPAGGPGETRPRQRQNSPPGIASAGRESLPSALNLTLIEEWVVE